MQERVAKLKEALKKVLATAQSLGMDFRLDEVHIAIVAEVWASALASGGHHEVPRILAEGLRWGHRFCTQSLDAIAIYSTDTLVVIEDPHNLLTLDPYSATLNIVGWNPKAQSWVSVQV
ncbi:WD40 repeat protein [Thermus phage P74-26]|uniref:WD40 repeat protein n=1 Tax=Thermus phage P74-26 TaxID=2914007 RepID=A7XXN2_BP742|nr:WD40 repeat protein [Thermus phage P74-26]ABU97010.1 WD40 repeat protein [Thermus phage P74-26]